MDFKQVINTRRSVRKFSPTVPSREVLLDIVHDALTAPSSRNMHTTRFMIVDDRETLDKIADMRDYGSGFMTGAPAAIVVMGDTTKTDLWRENCAISATMLQLSIVEHGLASCWVHVGGRPRLQNEPQGEQAEEYLGTFLDIPEGCKVECVIALGYSDFEPKPLPEWDAEASILWHTRL
ncbi:MAG: nitroreductase family protein [Alistipes sp.]|nr:nitroreductase family protein [Alistipes sp.]